MTAEFEFDEVERDNFSAATLKARNLWEDEPHPMCLLPTMRQFLDDPPVDPVRPQSARG
jgi:hypothetical protein